MNVHYHSPCSDFYAFVLASLTRSRRAILAYGEPTIWTPANFRSREGPARRQCGDRSARGWIGGLPRKRAAMAKSCSVPISRRYGRKGALILVMAVVLVANVLIWAL
jgi:hypothetical protein